MLLPDYVNGDLSALCVWPDQPMHVGFTSDEGGNTINLRWFRHKSNLHHVWDREIILTAAADYYGKEVDLLEQDIESNFTDGIWSDDLDSWRDCSDLHTCVTKYAAESINIACKWGYKGVEAGETLSDDYFNSRLPLTWMKLMLRCEEYNMRLMMKMKWKMKMRKMEWKMMVQIMMVV
ncbi:endonuclease 1-like [Coffea arabica]|uniref:Aspergillus nuclease S1 n=1 Tax=Coffea arabica TaxID=13443 RepID=A0A6P6W179_COFAR|nr:endonuclease 1-like [Coffea arabica]XP_027077501.1 endonuclease 1-like [Coffea arabica]XP_027108311.1 endonuclease 1-like [Coffea arabica]